ncbi:polymorphic toxin type 34 domain-containing protein [Escherichia coli]|uniref:polymorphic toxin type 34 domain-containing protein n=1 Tax=Escherichia coli TaxID=562 RepID=UPI0013ECB236
MSGKPAARQGDMTQYGGSIVQGSAGVRIGAPTGVACSVCPGGVTSGHPVNPLLGAKVLPGETDIALPGPLPFILSRTYSSYRTKTPAPVGSLGPGWKMPADIRLQLRDNTLILSDKSRRWLASCGLTVEQMQNQMDPVYTPARKIHLYHCDHRGLPLALISKEGTTEWCAEYDEWGNLLNEENPHQLQQLIRLPGQQYDEESGLYYNRHRYYDPLQGRYITQDPIGLKGGWNFYQYPLNPVTNTDPLGLEVFPRPFPLPIPWPKSPAQQQADDNAAKALTKWWNDTASQRIFDSLILNNPGLALDITMIASRGNVADTGITDRVNDIINDRFWSDGKKPDRCDVLQELIDCGDISAKDAKSTQKAWNCRHSRQSNDKKR